MSTTSIKLVAPILRRTTDEVSAISRYCNWYVADEGASSKPVWPGKAVGRSTSPNLLNLGIKDNLTTTDGSTTCSSESLDNYKSPFEATAVNRLRKCTKFPDFVAVKTRMDEFGMGSHSINLAGGAVRNIDPYGNRSAGGSSGGSAVGVALELCDLALGTDTGGSVRLPAAYTGVVGFKPSYGRISRHGLVPYANSMDTVGILSRDMNLLRVAFSTMEGSDPHDPTTVSPESRARFDSLLGNAGSGDSDTINKSENDTASRLDEVPKQTTHGLGLQSLRIGVPMEYNISELHLEVLISWRRVLKILQAVGHQLVPISLPSTKHALSAYYVLAAAEAASNLSKYDGVRYGPNPGVDDIAGALYSKTRGTGFGNEVKRRILLGSYSLSSEALDNHFIQAQKVRRIVQRDFDRVFKRQNPLHPEEQFDLSDMDENVSLESKLGPAQVDFILCPTAPSRPPLLSTTMDSKIVTTVANYMNDVFTVPASLAGLPAISIPMSIAVSRAGKNVPWVGMQLIGQYWDDFRLVDMATDVLRLLEYRSDRGKPTHVDETSVGQPPLFTEDD